MITVSIVTYNTEVEELKKCFNSLTSKMVKNIYVVDNSSKKYIEDFCKEYHNVIYIASENVGYGAAHNKAIRLVQNDKDVKLSCGKYTSAVLVKANLVKGEEEDNNSYKLYMWGLCHHDFFVNVKDVQSNHTFEEPFPIESTIPVIKPTIINTISAENMAIGEGINYFISSGYLKS